MDKTRIGGLVGGLGGLTVPGIVAAVMGLTAQAIMIALGILPVTLILGVATGAAIGKWIQNRPLPMLPAYKEEHKRLQQTARKVRANLDRLTGVKSARTELDEVLKKDVELRQQATLLKTQIIENSKRSLQWIDHLQGGAQLILQQIRMPGAKRIDGTDWTLEAYRAKLDREVKQLGKLLERAQSSDSHRDLQYAYRNKCVERATLARLEEAIAKIEAELTSIRAGIESILIQTTRLSHVGAAKTSINTSELFTPLQSEIQAFEDALREVLADSVDPFRQQAEEELRQHLRDQ